MNEEFLNCYQRKVWILTSQNESSWIKVSIYAKSLTSSCNLTVKFCHHFQACRARLPNRMFYGTYYKTTESHILLLKYQYIFTCLERWQTKLSFWGIGPPRPLNGFGDIAVLKQPSTHDSKMMARWTEGFRCYRLTVKTKSSTVLCWTIDNARQC